MKILFCCETMRGGGAEKVIATLSNQFSLLGHKVTIIMVSEGNSQSFYKLEKNVELISLYSYMQNKRHSIFNKVRELKKLVDCVCPDIVVSFLKHIIIYTYLALKKTKYPVVFSERNDPKSYSIIYKIVLKCLFKKANGCVFQTPDAKLWYGRSISKNSVVIPNPVGLSTSKLEHKNKNKRVFAVGRLEAQKNYKLLINAFDIFHLKRPDYKLIIYGIGKEEKRIKRIIERKNLKKHIELCGTNTNWHDIEFDSSVYVLSSKYEGMPNALAESLCLGIPCVSVNCSIGGPRFLSSLFPGRCVLCCTNNPKEMANKIEMATTIDFQDSSICDCLKPESVAKEWLFFLEDVLMGSKNEL